MGYATFKESGKDLIKSGDIGPGQVELHHLSPALFTEIRKINLHGHTGVGSRRIKTKDLTGPFSRGGFYIWSSDATKRYQVTVSSGTDDFVLTEA